MKNDINFLKLKYNSQNNTKNSGTVIRSLEQIKA